MPRRGVIRGVTSFLMVHKTVVSMTMGGASSMNEIQQTSLGTPVPADLVAKAA